MNSGMAISFASSMVSSCLPVSLSVRPKYRQYTTSSYIVFATSRAVAALFTFLFKYGIKGE